MKKLIFLFNILCVTSLLVSLRTASAQQNNSTDSIMDAAYFSNDLQMETKIQIFSKNSPNEDFAPFMWHNILFITSSRENNSKKQNTYSFTRQPFLDIYAFDEEGSVIDLQFLPKSLNTKMHDGPVAIARDSSLLLVTRNYPKPNRQGIQNLYLDFYIRSDNEWHNIDFPFNDINFSIQHPYYFDLTRTLYFSSNMPGGSGGFDLYRSVWDGNNWSQPENLGPEINSPYDEVFPSISPDGKLIYTSNHIETSGGLDLVMFKDSTRYLLPEPFNTIYDDFSISFINDTSGYFASNRDRSSHADNIYFFKITPQAVKAPVEPAVIEQPEEIIDSGKIDLSPKEEIPEPAYYIIIGSSKELNITEKEADRLNRLHNINVNILPPTTGGYYRISYGIYNSREEANSMLKYVRDNIRSDAWILRQ